jgi:ankyrin repeat protein
VHALTVFGVTPLHAASCNGHVNAVRSLLCAGANVKAVMRDGQTPLSLACQRGHGDAVRALLSVDAHYD